MVDFNKYIYKLIDHARVN